MMISATAFTDDKNIASANVDAVNVMSALGVIKGYEDGSFKPEGDVTRAEMAKMIYVIRNGGSDDASAYAAVPSKFTDLGAASWAAGYVKYCETMGIIAGKSATKFDPNGKVTLAETAKMALVLMGYKADKAGLVGSTWLHKTLALASENELLNKTSGAVTAAASRQEAAQVLRNLVDADAVIWSNDKEEFVSNNATVGEKYLGLKTFEGTFAGNDKTGATTKEGYIVVAGKAFPAAFDIKYIGEDVKVLYKDGQSSGALVDVPDKDDTIYGVYLSDTTSSVTVIAADVDVDGKKIELDDVKYEVVAGDVYYNYGAAEKAEYTDAATLKTKTAATTGDSVKFILNEDGKVKAAYIVKSDLAKVTAVSSTKVTLSGIGTIERDENDNDIYSGIAKDDVVSVTKLYNSDKAEATFVVEKAKTVSGEVTGYTGAEKVSVDKTSYKVYGKTTLANVTENNIASFNSDMIGEDVTLYFVNGYVRAADKSEDSMTKYALITDHNTGKLDSTYNKAEGELLLADGTKVGVKFHKDSTLLDSDAALTGTKYVGSIVKYAVMSDDTYKIQVVGDSVTVDADDVIYNKDIKSLTTASGKTTVVSADAVLFQKKGTKNYAYNLRSLGTITATAETDVKFALDKNDKVIAAYVEMDKNLTGSTANTVYGIVSSVKDTQKLGDDYYTELEVSYTDSKVTVFYAADAKTAVAKGNLVSFDKTSDDKYSDGDIKVLTGTKVAVKEYEDGATLAYYTSVTGSASAGYTGANLTVRALDDDAQVVYIDRDNKKGGDEIGVNEFDGNTGYANALIVLDGQKIVAIFVETSGECDITGATTALTV